MDERRTRGDGLLVVKVGGSLAETGRLASVLKTIGAAHVPVVIVPGGGPFADCVRNLQNEMRFDDAVAHRLALLAMEQMAECMAALEPGMKVARSREEILDAVMDGQIPVWAPLQIMAHDTTIPENWSVTSDSLAARLAELFEARLLLLKSTGAPQVSSARELAKLGIVDPFFPEIVERADLAWSIFGPEDDAALSALLIGKGTA